MDSTLEKIYSISPEQAQEYNKYVMLGSGGHGVCFEKGKGVRLWDINGKSYIDCTSQGWAMYLGHANEEIRQTVYEHMGNLGHLNQNSDAVKVVDIKDVHAGYACPKCGKPLKEERGIEVGQIFKLKTKYSAAMGCTYLNDKGVDTPMVMGCYGIGVTRTMASIIEQYHDDNGICWPVNVAPYHAVVIAVNYKDETQKKVADSIYETLKANKVEVVLDDRDAKPGFKFKDWDLIGIPMIITVGRRANEGIVEFKFRQENVKQEKEVNEVIDIVTEKVRKEA